MRSDQIMALSVSDLLKTEGADQITDTDMTII